MRKIFCLLVTMIGALMHKGFSVVVDYSLSLQEMIDEGKFSSTNEDIVEANFPLREKGKQKITIELKNFGKFMHPDDVLSDFDKKGLRPASLPELCALGAKYPGLKKKKLILALGSVWADPDSYCYYPCIHKDAEGRWLCLIAWHDGLDGHCWFATVRK
ncbi:MAG: hypothetical protein V1707_02690 [bacterium]